VTRRGTDDRAAEVWQFVRRQVAAGRQAYIVYPVIEGPNEDQPELDFPVPMEPEPKPAARGARKQAGAPSLFERPTLKAATDMYEQLRQGPLAGLRLGLLHGRLPSDDKEIVMRRFQRGELDVLVSTTVIEVGVDVPNATVMVIEHAERFGLAQLHQLRGRVGRGRAKSFCILMTGGRTSPEAEQRLDAMVRTQDGFELAELDLALRGPGEFFGTRQAGLPDFRIADLVRDRELLELARREAETFVSSGGAEATEAERALVAARLKQAWQRRYGLVEAG
jgi:ATP-dependent DNA helicase RecG